MDTMVTITFDAMWIVDLLLIVFLGIPIFIIFGIPLLVSIGLKLRLLPPYGEVVKFFDEDFSDKHYQDWLKKSPALFFSFVSIELYTSYVLVKIIRPFVKLYRWVVNDGGKEDESNNK